MFFFGFVFIFSIWILAAFIIRFIKEGVNYFDIYYWFIVWLLLILIMAIFSFYFMNFVKLSLISIFFLIVSIVVKKYFDQIDYKNPNKVKVEPKEKEKEN